MKALLDTYGALLLKAIGTHIVYSAISVAIGFVLGLALGILLSRVPRLSGALFPVISIFQTIPGLVFIGLLFLWLGMVPAAVIAALSVYAMFPVLKNTYTGLLGVEKKYIEAAKGCGMSPAQSLFKVELPLALPSIMAGLRMADGQQGATLLFLALEVLTLGAYSILWQQVLKRMPLNFAYSNKGVCTLWTCLFGVLFFGESLTLGKAAGILVVLLGLYALLALAFTPRRA